MDSILLKAANAADTSDKCRSHDTKQKYEFTSETKEFVYELRKECGERHVSLRRIRRLSDGLVGGWIERWDNLDQDGDCFIYDNAIVFGEARVGGNATVGGDAIIYDNAVITDPRS